MEIKEALKIVSEGGDLKFEQSRDVFQVVLNGGANHDQIGALLMGLKRNGETAAEIAGAVQVLRSKAVKFNAPEGTIDICGTGGDGLNTLNISTAAAFVVAACGVPIAKHGNRAVSSACGSADVLEALGINIEVEPAIMERCLKETNFAFLYAPKYHPAMREMSPIRKNLGFRTLFNLVGPLVNPANVKRQLIGVSSIQTLGQFGELVSYMDYEKVWIVHSKDGMDEFSISDINYVKKYEQGKLTDEVFDPNNYLAGRETRSLLGIKGGDAKFNANEICQLFLGKRQSDAEVVVAYNATCALRLCGFSEEESFNMVSDAIHSGKAHDVLTRVMQITNEHA